MSILSLKSQFLGVRKDGPSDLALSSFILKVKAAEIVPSGWPYISKLFLSL